MKRLILVLAALFIVVGILTSCDMFVRVEQNVDTNSSVSDKDDQSDSPNKDDSGVEPDSPHIHVFVDGKCECGETDPSYIAPTPPAEGEDPSSPPTDENYIYNEFTSSERNKILNFAGFIIPFIPTDEYYLEEYEMGDDVGLNYYTYGNREADLEKFLSSLSGFVFAGTYQDEYGETWYCYDKGKYMIDASYYLDEEGNSVIDIYLYVNLESGGSGSGSDGGFGTEDADLITNIGASLPEGTGGVYEIEFTDAMYVKDVTELASFAQGCPTTGSPSVLVIPVDFSDRTAASLGYSIDTLEDIFLEGSEGCDYYSVYDYYYASSYGQLSLDFTILNEWFRPSYRSTYYALQTMEYGDEEIFSGDQLILNEALAYLDPLMDLSRFDSDSNGTIDAVILVTTVEIDRNTEFGWAYRYWNLYADSYGNYYTYDDVYANDFVWISYQFMFKEDKVLSGTVYTNKTVRNSFTFIHEFGHVLGADDYYDYAGKNELLQRLDIMDDMPGDHNPFTKIYYGWIKNSRLVTTESSITLSIEDFTKSGDTVIIGSNWDPKLGVFQEYYILMYYTNNGLNAGKYGYFESSGILVYRVNASLCFMNEGYYVYNNNTDVSDPTGTEDNLIEFAKTSDGSFIFGVGDKPESLKDSTGNSIGYTFTVNSLTSTSATVTFTKI